MSFISPLHGREVARSTYFAHKKQVDKVIRARDSKIFTFFSN